MSAALRILGAEELTPQERALLDALQQVAAAQTEGMKICDALSCYITAMRLLAAQTGVSEATFTAFLQAVIAHNPAWWRHYRLSAAVPEGSA
ncbi:MAG: hypothetical protein Kow00114_27310 [Kiloniellaceae bacterium]